jgi:flagellar biosynthesis protein
MSDNRKKAVAITYSHSDHEAPIVVAKGMGSVAETILRRAEESGIHIREDKSLVELLASIDLNQQIPPELYQVVAEVLAFVYKMDSKRS